jgi:O-antigen ligase
VPSARSPTHASDLSVNTIVTTATSERPGLPLAYRILVAAYIPAILLFSYRADLTLGAKIIALLMVVAFGAYAFSSQRRIVIPLVYRLWLIWFLIALLSATFADPYPTGRLLTVVQVTAIGFLITHFLIWNGSTRFYWITFVGAALVSLAFYWSDPATFTTGGQVAGTLGNANHYGNVLVIALIFSFVGALTEKRLLSRVIFLVASVILFAMLLYTASRQSWLAALLAGAVVLLLYLDRSRTGGVKSFIPALVFSFLVGLAALYYLVTSEFWYRMDVVLDTVEMGDLGVADASFATRVWLYVRAWEIAWQHPWLGVGLGNFERQPMSDVQLGPIQMYSHSNYMEILSTTGFMGFIVFFSMYAVLMMNIVRSYSRRADAALFAAHCRASGLLTALLVFDLGLVTYYDKWWWLAFGYLVAELSLISDSKTQMR